MEDNKVKAYERLIKYAQIPTASDEASDSVPSTPEQLDFARFMVEEMKAIGIEDAKTDENGYAFGTIPATPGYEDVDVIGYLAHNDTVREVQYWDIKPSVIECNGEYLPLNEEKGIRTTLDECPDIARLKGKHLVVTDGTTLLGADDKAGTATIMAAAERLLANEVPHGKIRLGFTPDEEIGRGPDHFDVKEFGARFAYTLDGGRFGEVCGETFNAASARVLIQGYSTHPGAAKNKMRNAIRIAAEFDSCLPDSERPETTEDREGFYHSVAIKGQVDNAEIDYIIRDHDYSILEKRIQHLEEVRDLLNGKYGAGTITLEISHTYDNMAKALEPYPQLMENAKEAIRACGGTVIETAVRGGTDGSQLSYMGLPCPNLGTGAYVCHSVKEFACCEEMDQTVDMLVCLAGLFARR